MDVNKDQDNLDLIALKDFDEPGHHNRRRFPVPVEFKTIFPIIRNKYDLENKEEIKQWIDWFHTYSQLPDHKYKVIKATVPFIGYCYPTCKNFERYEMIVGLFLGGFTIDDYVDNDPDNFELHSNEAMVTLDYFEKCVQKLTSDEFIPIVGWPSYVTAFYAVLETTSSKYNRNQKERFVRVLLHYIQGNREEVNAIKENMKFENIDQLFEIRLKSIGGIFMAQLIEYADDICVTDEEWDDQDFQTLLILVCKIMVLTNDVFSFEKEYVQQKGDLYKMFNSVAVIVVQDTSMIEVAMNKVIAMIVTLETEALKMMNKMLSNDIYRDDMKLMIRNTQYFISGTYISGKECARYVKYNEN